MASGRPFPPPTLVLLICEMVLMTVPTSGLSGASCEVDCT